MNVKKFPFDLGRYGKIIYNQWGHPGEGKKNFSEATVDFWRRFYFPGAIAIDIGAHTGDTTLPIAAAGFEHTIAFEPNSVVFEILEENKRDNQHLSIECHQWAVMAKDGAYDFGYGDEGYCNGGFAGVMQSGDKVEKIPGRTYPLRVFGINLVDFLERRDVPLDKIGLIKIDAEGYDKEILRTLKAITDFKKVGFLIEVFRGLSCDAAQDLDMIVKMLDYHGEDIRDGSLIPNILEYHKRESSGSSGGEQDIFLMPNRG